MKITLIEPKSYCAGVTNAIKIALKAKQDYPQRKIYVLGRLVHNQLVINELSQKGIISLYSNKKTYEQLIAEAEPGSILIFSAHGHDKKLNDVAIKNRLMILDTTCPIVKRNIDTIQKEIDNHHQVIYIGHKDHPETLAALSIDKNVILYDVDFGMNKDLIIDKSPLVINQTTLNILDIQNNYQDILHLFPEARISEEICNTTRLRQEAVINLPDDVDLILVVGDNNSSNSKRLYEVARISHPDIDSFLINHISELEPSLLKEKKHVAIASGASTPMFAIEEIIEYIRRLDD